MSPLSTEVFAAPDPVDPVATADPHCADAHIVATQRVGSDCEGTSTAEIHLRTRSWQVWFTDFYCFGFKQAEDDDYLLVVHVSASVDLKIF